MSQPAGPWSVCCESPAERTAPPARQEESEAVGSRAHMLRRPGATIAPETTSGGWPDAGV